MNELLITKKKIMSLSIPTIISLSSNNIMGLVSLSIISLLGYKNIAIVGITNIFCQNIVLLLVSVCYQVSMEVAQNLGKKEENIKEEIAEIIKCALHSIFIFNLPILLLLVLLSPIIMKILGLSAELIELGQIYFSIRIFSIIFIAISRILLGGLRGMEEMKKAMYATITANIVNIILSYIFIKYFNLGLISLAFSLLISEIIQSILLAVFLKKFDLHILKLFFSKINFEKSKFLYLEGIKIGLQDVGVALTAFFFSAFAARIGVKELAATEVVLNVLSFSYLPGIALGITAAAEVSKILGSKEVYKKDILLKLKNNLLICASYFTIPVALISGIFSRKIALFFVDDFEVQNMISKVLLVVMYFLIFDAFQMVLMDATRGFGDNTTLAFISLGLGVFFIPFCYIITFVLNFGLIGMWIAFYIYIFLQFLFLYLKYNFESSKFQ